MLKFQFNEAENTVYLSLGISHERGELIMDKMHGSLSVNLDNRVQEVIAENKESWIAQAKKVEAGGQFKLEVQSDTNVEKTVMKNVLILANELDLSYPETAFMFFLIGTYMDNIKVNFDKKLIADAEVIFMESFNEGKPDEEKMMVMMVNKNDPNAEAILKAHEEAMKAAQEEGAEIELDDNAPDYPFPYTGPIAHA